MKIADFLIHKWKEIFILGAIVLLGLVLRIYNINFPSVGYHNMKENEYLSMAEEMKRTNDFVTRRIYFYNVFEDNPTVRLYPQPPLVSYQILFSWIIFGENLWGARLINVFFGILSILVIYFIALLLFKRVKFALPCAFLLAIMPLAVFFSRNLQPESGGFFFMILSNLFYLKFISSLKKYNLILGGLSLWVAWLYKMSFFIGILPILFCFPYSALLKNKKEFFKTILAFLLPFLVILITVIWLKRIDQWEFEQLSRVRLWEVFTRGYWQKYGLMIWRYIEVENFTLVYFLTTLIGIASAFFKRKGLLNRYLIGWVFTIIPYSMVFSDYINQHNYYQMPFLILVCVASIYAVSAIAQIVKRLLNKEIFIYLLVAIVAVSASFVYGATSRMYGTVFLGQDVAGDSLKEFTALGERVFLLTHCQGNAIARYAQRYMGWPETLEDFKKMEEKYKIRFICFYPGVQLFVLEKNNSEYFAYIQNNYHLKEIGLLQEYNQLNYFILERGKGSDIKKALESIPGQLQARTVYRLLGQYIFFYIIRPVS